MYAMQKYKQKGKGNMVLYKNVREHIRGEERFCEVCGE